MNSFFIKKKKTTSNRESLWGSDFLKITDHGCAAAHEFHMIHPLYVVNIR